MTRRLAMSTLLVLVFSLTAGASLACTCMNYPTPTEAYNSADLVFSGMVVSITPVNQFEVAVVFQTYAVWKGETMLNHVVVTGVDSGVCGYEFVEGGEYLVYSYAGMFGFDYYTDSCTRDNLLSQAETDLISLGAAMVLPNGTSAWGTLKAAYR